MFGLTFEKLLIIGVIAALLIGPERLPQLASQFANLVKAIKRMAETGKERLREDLGEHADEVDWAALDPRRYDPRRIVRDAISSAFDDADPSSNRAVFHGTGTPSHRAVAKTQVAADDPQEHRDAPSDNSSRS